MTTTTPANAITLPNAARHEMASRYSSHDRPTITAGMVVEMSVALIAVVKVSAL